MEQSGNWDKIWHFFYLGRSKRSKASWSNTFKRVMILAFTFIVSCFILRFIPVSCVFVLFFPLLLIVLITFPCLFSPCVFPSLRCQFVFICFVFVPHVSSAFPPVFPALHSVCPWFSFSLLHVSLVLSFFCLFFNISFSSKLALGSTICLPGICNWVIVLLQSPKSCLM